ncbi:hypothetical protein L3V79_09095 [Thiotrichales bacterium 19S9-12]|nr:hypothetical protein [Thiotrichales bacterium 19S9-11]MCF6812513.1 hypothetical protein [Thiotrichales bacterium 19S9-12]
MNQSELFRIAIAITLAVRNNEKYSQNIPMLYNDPDSIAFRKVLSHDLDKLRDSIPKKSQSHSPARAQAALKYKTGLCDEVSTTATYLGSLAVSIGETAYITSIYTPTHVFCLIHQDKNLANITDRQKVAASIEELSKNYPSAVVTDPWFCSAFLLSNYKSAIDHASTYSKINHYAGSIITIGYSEQLKRVNPLPEDTKTLRLIRDYDRAYQFTQKDFPGLIEFNTFGINFDSLKAKLSFDISRRRDLMSLRFFIERLSSQKSIWYSNFGHSDRKGKQLDKLCKILDKAINKHMDISNDKLRSILNSALNLSLVVRGSSVFSFISEDQIPMTDSAKSLLWQAVLPKKSYRFEKIEGMSLDRIREIRSSHDSDQQKYCDLVKFIKDDNLCINLKSEESKEALYTEVESLLQKATGKQKLLFYDEEIQILDHEFALYY